MVKIRNYTVWGYSAILKRSIVQASFWKRHQAEQEAKRLRRGGVRNISIEHTAKYFGGSSNHAGT